MQSYKLTFLLLSFFITQHAYSSVNDFDVMCQIFTEANNSSLTWQEKSQYVTENIQQRVTSQNVKDVFTGIRTLPPEVRYDLVKESAQLELKQDWDCPTMQALLSPRDNNNQVND